MTYQEAAQTAIDVQDACNLSGVVFSLREAMQAICDEQHRLGEGTEWKNRNPIVTLFLSKLCDLNLRAEPFKLESEYYTALDSVKQITRS